MTQAIELENQYGAHYYHPIPVVLARGKGAIVWDEAGKAYLDMMSAYSAVSLGHCHPEIVATLQEQAQRLAMVSRAFHHDLLGQYLQKACALTQMAMAAPLNTGVEAVEFALKAARKWAYTVKGVAEDKAEIIACQGNFHGRTIAVIGLSSEPGYRQGFGPFPPGLKVIPYGDIAALAQAITKNTAALLLEPIQGEGGIIIPPAGYLQQCQALCRQHKVLLICDEVQTGLARTGKFLACEHESVKPDGLILGKALGGGVLPVSLFLGTEELMQCFKPGDHGSTFGGYSLACAVAMKALDLLSAPELIEHSRALGAYFVAKLQALDHPLIKDVRGRGLFVGIEIDNKVPAREICSKLLIEGVLSKETHDTVVRMAPPLVVTQAQIDQALAAITTVLQGY